jgi:hypothetical protein
LALALRVGLFACGPWNEEDRAKRDDSWRILLLADNLRKYGTYGKAEEDGRVHEAVAKLRAANGTLPPPDANGLRPESFRPPGYPFLVAAVGSVLPDLRWVLLIQCILGALMTWPVVRIASVFGLSGRGAIVAGLLWAIHPALVLFDSLFLTESLFNILVLAGLFLGTFSGRWWHWAGCGLLLGFAGLVRPLALLYLPFALGLAYRGSQLKWRTAIPLVLATLLPSVLWAYRNHKVGEGWRVTTAGDINLLYYTAAYSISEEKGEDWLVSWPVRIDELSGRLKERLTEDEDVFAAGSRLALEELRARPGPACRVLLKSSVKLFSDHSAGSLFPLLGQPYHPTGFYSRFILREEKAVASGSLAAMIVAGLWSGLNAAIALAALLGIVRGLWNRLFCLTSLCCLTLLLFLAATGSVGLERMRLPMQLPLFLLAGVAFTRACVASACRQDLGVPAAEIPERQE